MALLWLLSCLTLVSAANLGCDPNFDYKTTPYALILENYNQIVTCTCTFVAENWLITAASCKHLPKRGSTLMLSIYFPLSDKWYTLKSSMFKIIIHPQDATHTIDIALIKLPNDFSIKEYNIKPVCLPDDSEERTYERCSTSGCYKATTSGILPQTIALSQEDVYRKIGGGYLYLPLGNLKCKQVTFHLLNNTDCQRYYGRTIQSTMICGNDPSAPSCPATMHAPSFKLATGAPLMCERNGTWTLLGVASFGLSFSSMMFYTPVVFTRISQFTEWINQTIAAN